MATKKTESAEEESEETPKKSKKIKIIVAALCLGLAGGAYYLGGAGAAAPAALTDESTTTTTTIQKRGCEGTSADEAPLHVADLPAMSINLSDGHYLRVTISLGLCDDVVPVEGEEFLSAPARDIAVATLSGRSMAELTDDEGRRIVKEELTTKISEAYPGEVYEVFFVEFVMQ